MARVPLLIALFLISVATCTAADGDVQSANEEAAIKKSTALVAEPQQDEQDPIEAALAQEIGSYPRAIYREAYEQAKRIITPQNVHARLEQLSRDIERERELLR